MEVVSLAAYSATIWINAVVVTMQSHAITALQVPLRPPMLACLLTQGCIRQVEGAVQDIASIAAAADGSAVCFSGHGSLTVEGCGLRCQAVATWGMVPLFYAVSAAVSAVPGFGMYGVTRAMVATPAYWLALPPLLALAVAPMAAFHLWDAGVSAAVQVRRLHLTPSSYQPGAGVRTSVSLAISPRPCYALPRGPHACVSTYEWIGAIQTYTNRATMPCMLCRVHGGCSWHVPDIFAFLPYCSHHCCSLAH